MDSPALVLASGSPRRAAILRTLGVAFRVVVSQVAEDLLPGERGEEAVERLAGLKAAAVATAETLPVLAADTTVLCDGEILNKPGSPEEAASMLRRLSGRPHDVVTGVCLVAGRVARSGLERSTVSFAPLSEDDIAWYVATGEPFDKAGGYHVDGKAALFIEAVSGSPTNVAGLPVRLVKRLAAEAGLSLGWPL